MLSLALGPGGPFRRVLADFVPFLFGGLVGWMAGPFVGAVLGIAVGVLACLGLSALLRWVRRRPVLRRVWRFALLFPGQTTILLCLGGIGLAAAAGVLPARLATRRRTYTEPTIE